jgi:hypothetical protein
MLFKLIQVSFANTIVCVCVHWSEPLLLIKMTKHIETLVAPRGYASDNVGNKDTKALCNAPFFLISCSCWKSFGIWAQKFVREPIIHSFLVLPIGFLIESLNLLDSSCSFLSIIINFFELGNLSNQRELS